MIPDPDLTGSGIAAAIAELADDPQRRKAMGLAARGLAMPGATASIADAAIDLISGKGASVDVS